ncbi:MAG: DM13 domain-containing protein [Chloroflexi bacterium]|nr:DM13 domain-containing protein [Chloroflexota bacterium]
MGAFRDADNFHKGSGQATIYQLPDGTHLLRLEDFKVTNGPELHVLLTPHPDPTSRSQVMGPGYIDLGDLKGNVGNQNYTIPIDVDVAGYQSVVIYCNPFHVIFSVAPLVIAEEQS